MLQLVEILPLPWSWMVVSARGVDLSPRSVYSLEQAHEIYASEAVGQLKLPFHVTTTQTAASANHTEWSSRKGPWRVSVFKPLLNAEQHQVKHYCLHLLYISYTGNDYFLQSWNKTPVIFSHSEECANEKNHPPEFFRTLLAAFCTVSLCNVYWRTQTRMWKLSGWLV